MRLHFRSFGAGPPLVILHGLFGSLDNWHSVSQKLSSHFHVVAVDQRNHGQSPHCDEMCYPLMAQDLEELLLQLELPDAHVLGHSMGGKTAMQFALSFPHRTRRLIVVDIAPRAYPPRHTKTLSALLALDLTSTSDRRDLERALAHGVPNLATRQFLLKSVKRDDAGRFHWQLGLAEIQRSYSRLGQAVAGEKPFTGPTLFLRGERSDYLTAADLPQIQQLFPRAEMRTVAGAGHLPHVENAPALLAAVTEFLLEPD